MTFAPESVEYRFDFDRDDDKAPRGISVDDAFFDRDPANVQAWRVTEVKVTRFPGTDEAPKCDAYGWPIVKSGKADRRNGYAHAVVISDELEAAFVDAAK